jgi:CHASE2 domain-containing sensor protein
MPADTPSVSSDSGFAATFTVAALALAGLAFHLSPWGERASLAMLDAGFGVLRAVGPKTAPDDILVVALDDAAAVSPDVDAVGPALRRLPDILVRVARGRPQAIALLAPLPRSSLDKALPGFDEALAAGLLVAQSAAPLLIGMAVDSRGDVIPIHDRLLRDVDARALAFTLLPRDADGMVRQVALSLPTQQGQWPTAAGWLCQMLSGRCESGLVDYALGPAYRYMPARRLLEIRDEKALARLFQGRVVFIAPVTGPADRVPQPVSLAGWEQPTREPPSVLAHAQALRTLLHGRPLREGPLPLQILAIGAAALLVLVAAPVASAATALAMAGACGIWLAALWNGWYLPLAAPVATLAAALPTGWLLHRRPRACAPP